VIRHKAPNLQAASPGFLTGLCAATLMFQVTASAADLNFRIECVSVPGGAELLTVLAPALDDEGEVPLVSVLRDTLGDADPQNDRLRSVWMLTSDSPSVLQRLAATVPFFYWRPGSKSTKPEATKVLDLSNANASVWSSLARSLTSVMAIDSTGPMIRASTRRYLTNVGDRRRAQLVDALTVLSQMGEDSDSRDAFSDAEWFEIQARLMLGGQTFGGLVTQEKLPDAYMMRRSQQLQMRGHNWELLRQSADRNGLYFEPLGPGASQTYAVLWIAREDVGSNHDFDEQFLEIQNPYNDNRLSTWSGFSVTRWYDPTGRQVEPHTGDAVERELIPLALYSLDYPKVPLRLVDFRRARAARSREMMGHAMSDFITGLLGVTKWGNWPYWAASSTWTFVRTRHGTPTNSAKRLEAYASVRQWLALDRSLDPSLRLELQQRLEVMGVNPLDRSGGGETRMARQRYETLLAYAADVNGLPARLAKDRASELKAYKHGVWVRSGLKTATVASLGGYSHREGEPSTELVASLDNQRRTVREQQFLKAVTGSTKQPELVWNVDEIRRAEQVLSNTLRPARSDKTAERFPTRATNGSLAFVPPTTE
jgi:hypothetical protein